MGYCSLTYLLMKQDLLGAMQLEHPTASSDQTPRRCRRSHERTRAEILRFTSPLKGFAAAELLWPPDTRQLTWNAHVNIISWIPRQ